MRLYCIATRGGTRMLVEKPEKPMPFHSYCYLQSPNGELTSTGVYSAEKFGYWKEQEPEPVEVDAPPPGPQPPPLVIDLNDESQTGKGHWLNQDGRYDDPPSPRRRQK
jgi:hypothetical protein